jgi:hypothetical protein
MQTHPEPKVGSLLRCVSDRHPPRIEPIEISARESGEVWQAPYELAY